MEWEELQRDHPLEPDVARQIDDAHSAGAQPGRDLIVAERPADEGVD